MNATRAARSVAPSANAGMPVSTRPSRITGMSLSPPTSAATSAELVRSGPLSPPAASRPWQKPQRAVKSDCPGGAASRTAGACARGHARKRMIIASAEAIRDRRRSQRQASTIMEVSPREYTRTSPRIDTATDRMLQARGVALLGIDVGTTGSRALVLDETGRTASASADHDAFRSLQTGWAEQDPDDWWRACQLAVRGALAASGTNGAAIQAIGLSGQMPG